MRRYKYATALLASMMLISGCRSHSTQGRWSSPVRAACSCASHLTGRSYLEADSTGGPSPPVPSATPSTQPSSESESVDQPAPFPADVDGGDPVDAEGKTWSLDNPVPPSDPIESLQSLGGLLKFNDEGDLLVADLTDTPATDAHVELLIQIESLHAVDLSGTQVTSACLKSLCKLSKLKMLGLCDLPFDDQAIRNLVDLEDLRFLSLERTEITDDGLRYLRALIHLEGVSLRGTAVTREAVHDFRRAHPDCRVLSDDDEQKSSFNVQPNDHSSRRPFWAGVVTDEGSWPPPQPVQPRREVSSNTARANAIPASTDDPERVVQQLQQIVSARLSDQVVLAAAGRVYLAQERWDDAVSVLSAALEQDPYDDRVRFDLAVALGRFGDIDESLLRFTEVIGPATAHYNIGVLLYEDGEVQLSRYFFRQASQRDPQLEISEDLVPQFSRQESPGINVQGDAMRAVSSNELLKLVAGPAQQSGHDENWSIDIVPIGSADAAPRCLTTLQSDGTLSIEPATSAVDSDIDWVSPISWTAAPSWDD